CDNVIKGFDEDYWCDDYTDAQITLPNLNTVTGACNLSTQDITISSPENARLWLRWVDGGLIESVAGEPIRYVPATGEANTYVREGATGCQPISVEVDPNNPAVGRFIERNIFADCAVVG